MENEYKQYFRKDRIKDFYFLSYFIFILSLIGETDVNEEEVNDDEKEPVDEEKVNTSEESEPSWLELNNFRLGLARDLFYSARN